MKIQRWTFGLPELTEFSNEVKEALVKGLEQEGMLNEAEAIKVNEDYAVVIVRKGFFGRLFDKSRGFDKENLFIKFVKVID